MGVDKGGSPPLPLFSFLLLNFEYQLTLIPLGYVFKRLVVYWINVLFLGLNMVL